MKQHEVVIKVMEEHGGYATLGQLNQSVFKVEGCEWKTRTPVASIRRIVQDERFFFKIRPGLWALNEVRGNLPFKEIVKARQSTKADTEFSHSYYQGLLVEIGNLRGFHTTVPNQDKNKRFLEKPLSQLVTADCFYHFTYDSIV